jgi:hypothetical protein
MSNRTKRQCKKALAKTTKEMFRLNDHVWSEKENDYFRVFTQLSLALKRFRSSSFLYFLSHHHRHQDPDSRDSD